MIISKRRSSFCAINPIGGDLILGPVSEGPTPESYHDVNKHSYKKKEKKRKEKEKSKSKNKNKNKNKNKEMEEKESPWENMVVWVKGHVERSLVSHYKRSSDPQLLLSVLGCPLAPFAASPHDLHHHHHHHHAPPTKTSPVETSCAQYIIHQYLAAAGGLHVLQAIRTCYTRGKVRMLTTEFETATRIARHPIKAAENGWFVLWQMMPDKWHLELEIEGSSVQAGSNGKVVWRYTPWLGAHATHGPVRPLRRAIQGLDPIATANMFINAQCTGEKKIGDEDCFVLKLSIDPATPGSRNDGPAEIIRHVLYGYFSQKTGLLVFIEDTHLTRIQSTGAEAVYWETTIASYVQDYKKIDGVNIAHSGHSIVTLYKFGEEPMSHTKTKMEEMWSIEEVAFNVEGLSMDYFLPPSEVGKEITILDQ